MYPARRTKNGRSRPARETSCCLREQWGCKAHRRSGLLNEIDDLRWGLGLARADSRHPCRPGILHQYSNVPCTKNTCTFSFWSSFMHQKISLDHKLQAWDKSSNQCKLDYSSCSQRLSTSHVSSYSPRHHVEVWLGFSPGIYTYMHAYIHIYIHTCMHTYIIAYIHTCYVICTTHAWYKLIT